MRRAAVFDIFDQLGLIAVPSNMWVFTDEADDLAAGLERFFAALGIDPAGLRLRKRAERRKANELLELLIDIGDAFSRLQPVVVDRIAERIHSGDYDAVRAAARAVSVMERINRWRPTGASSNRLRIFTEFFEQVDDGLRDPLSLTPEDLDEAESLFTLIAALNRRFDAANAAYDHLRSELERSWPRDWKGGREADELTNTVSQYENIALALRTTPHLPAGDVDGALLELETLNAALAGLLAAAEAAAAHARASSAGGRASSGSSKRRARGSHGSKSGKSGHSGSKRSGSPPPPPGDPQAAAKVFFGFRATSSPSKQHLKKAYLAFMREHHPDRAGADPADLARRNELCKQANAHREALGF